MEGCGYDVLSKNVSVIDGMGSPEVEAEVAISDDEIVTVDSELGEAETDLDGEAKVLKQGLSIFTNSDCTCSSNRGARAKTARELPRKS